MYVYSSHTYTPIHEYIHIHTCWYALNNAMKVRLEMSAHRAKAV